MLHCNKIVARIHAEVRIPVWRIMNSKKVAAFQVYMGHKAVMTAKSDPNKPNLVLVAQVSAAIGLQGEFKLLSFTEDPFSVLEYSPLLNDTGAPALVLTKAREHKGNLVVRAEGIPDRTAAEKIMGLKLYIDRAEFPEPEDDEYYIADLIGMEAFDAAGARIGRVVNVDNFGAGDLLDIQPLEGASFYLAFTAENVTEVDLDARRIIVDLTGI